MLNWTERSAYLYHPPLVLSGLCSIAWPVFLERIVFIPEITAIFLMRNYLTHLSRKPDGHSN